MVGNFIYWRTVKSELFLAIEITSASINGGIVANLLIDKLKESYGEAFNTKHCIMDSGYNIQDNYTLITGIISFNRLQWYCIVVTGFNMFSFAILIFKTIQKTQLCNLLTLYKLNNHF